jgi:hypothetical protein
MLPKIGKVLPNKKLDVEPNGNVGYVVENETNLQQVSPTIVAPVVENT